MSDLTRTMMMTATALGMVVLGGCGDEPDPRTERPFPQAAKADLPGSCSDSCGAQAGAGCWCDAQCLAYRDCCPDYAEACDADRPQPCAGVCVYGAHCSDYCPPGASCIKVMDPGESYWLVLGCRVW